MTRQLIFLFAALATACGASNDNIPDTPQSMVERGAALYAANCAKCHGDSGQGTDQAPPVVGPEALPLDPRPGAVRDVRFRTALDVFQWVRVAMPGDDPASLTDDEYLAIMAFDLTANGVSLPRPLDAELAASIVLHTEP
jgi:S-disulfanyl-L-cysteine oxidoreductase SoxD